MKRNAVILIGIIILLGCSSDDGIVLPPDLYPPVVSGIWRTYEDGTVKGQIGNPKDKRKGELITCYYIYPNPSVSFFGIRLKMQKASQVRIWISPANYSDELLADITGMAITMVPNYAKSVMCFSGYLETGENALSFDLNKIFKNNELSSFYRVYIATDDELLWTDLMIYKK